MNMIYGMKKLVFQKKFKDFIYDVYIFKRLDSIHSYHSRLNFSKNMLNSMILKINIKKKHLNTF